MGHASEGDVVVEKNPKESARASQSRGTTGGKGSAKNPPHSKVEGRIAGDEHFAREAISCLNA